MSEEKKEKEVNLEDFFQDLFQQTSGTGEEELLRIASTFSIQITGQQMKCLLFLKSLAEDMEEKEKHKILSFIESWVDFKRYNNSAMFVMKALEYISLKKFLGENSIKVNIEK